VPYNDPNLLNGNGSTDANASPFVIAVRNAGIAAVPSIMNAVILIAVLSVGNSAVYGSSRTLAALADRNQAPKILGYIDQTGRPIVAIALAAVIGLLCFLAGAGTDTRTQAFNWMLAISGLSSILTWASICACHIRFRHVSLPSLAIFGNRLTPYRHGKLKATLLMSLPSQVSLVIMARGLA
jgi:amino acid transporter